MAFRDATREDAVRRLVHVDHLAILNMPMVAPKRSATVTALGQSEILSAASGFEVVTRFHPSAPAH
jgi:hypothetical protein